jgi:hypothetical protein
VGLARDPVRFADNPVQGADGLVRVTDEQNVLSNDRLSLAMAYGSCMTTDSAPTTCESIFAKRGNRLMTFVS